MKHRIYLFLSWLLRTFSHRMKTEWEVPFDGEPCVFVGNHCGALGPIDMCTKFPLRDECRPWFNDSVRHLKEIPAYVRQDYWWKPGCRLEWFYNATLPYLGAIVLAPIMNLVPGVPVYHDNRVIRTMKESLRLLDQGKHLVIFPEQPSGWRSHHTWINAGFLQVAVMYYRRTGKALKFWPVHIDTKGHVFQIAAPVAFDPERSLEDQQEELLATLAAGLRGEKLPAAVQEEEPEVDPA